MRFSFGIYCLTAALWIGFAPAQSVAADPPSKIPAQPQSTQSPQVTTPPLTWQTFSSEPGDFTVLMPSPPVQAVLPIEPNGAIREGYMFMQCRLEGSFTACYAVAYADSIVDLSQLNPTMLDQALDSTIRGMVGEGTVISQREVAIDRRYPGREVEFEAGSTDGIRFTKARCYAVGQRLYIVMVLAQPFAIFPQFPIPTNVRPQAADTFLDSFALTNTSP